MPTHLERAKSGRSTCKICLSAIAKDEVRIVDKTEPLTERELHSTAFYHLTCAIEMRRELAHHALCARETPDDFVAGIIDDVARLDAKLADEARAHREQRGTAVTRDERQLDDARTLELLAELEVNPSNRGLLEVLADHLQLRGDPRGTLIMLDLAGSTAPDVLARRRELTIALSPKHLDLDRAQWGIGFLRKLTIFTKEQPSLETLFAHPSCRLVEVIDINRYGSRGEVILRGLPRSLRSITLFGGLARGSDLSDLPNLELLHVDTFHELASPSLLVLELERSNRDTVLRCKPGNLPKLERLRINLSNETGGVVQQLVRAGWFERLMELELSHVVIDLGELAMMESALAGRRLARLSVAFSSLTPIERPRLEALCDVLEFSCRGDEETGVVYIEHTNKPEWGRGTLVREFDNKVEVAFESGTRTFKADAPFLKRSR